MNFYKEWFANFIAAIMIIFLVITIPIIIIGIFMVMPAYFASEEYKLTTVLFVESLNE